MGGDDESPSEQRACSQTAQRFRSADEVVHRGAFVELYLHELVLRLGATVDIDVGNDHDDDRRPDLLLTVGEIETFVEASAVAGADVHDAETKRHLDAIHDAVNAVNAPAFFVDVDVEEHGSSTHSSRAGRDVDRDITHALLGSKGYYYNKELGQVVGERQRDGAWMGPKGPTNTRLSAVLTLVNLSPMGVCAVEPTLWTNPWASHPITDPAPRRRIECHESGRTIEHPATRTVADVFSLPQRWPAVPRHPAD